MKSYTEILRTDLENIRKISKSRSKYPYNTTYKENERDAKIELDKDYKKLISFVSENNSSTAVEDVLKTIAENMKIILSSSFYDSYESKDRAINNILLELNTLDILGNKDVNLQTAEPLPVGLTKKFGKNFETEIKDLNLVWGRSGDCTAFLLRRIIEKTIFYSFAKSKLIDKLENPTNPKKYVGLADMIKIAEHEKRSDGLPFLLPKTADRLLKIKFLGDTAAHDFLTNIYSTQLQKDEIDTITIALGELLNP